MFIAASELNLQVCTLQPALQLRSLEGHADDDVVVVVVVVDGDGDEDVVVVDGDDDNSDDYYNLNQ